MPRVGSEGPATTYTDEQTGKTFLKVHENAFAVFMATVSIVYLIGFLAFLIWQLFDVWSNRCRLLTWLGYDAKSLAGSTTFRIVTYTVIAGGMGGIINGIRSFLVWHCEEAAFGPRFLWKYVTFPLVGSTLALFVLALIRGGMAVLGGDISVDGVGFRQSLTYFGIGLLAGYGARDVFVWLDVQVMRVFRVDQIKVPNLLAKTRQEAEKLLSESGLALGPVKEEIPPKPEDEGKVIKQEPAPTRSVSPGSLVSITIGTKQLGQSVEEKSVPDLLGKTDDEARKILTDAGFVIGGVTKQPATNDVERGRIISQSPGGATKALSGSPVSFVVAE